MFFNYGSLSPTFYIDGVSATSVQHATHVVTISYVYFLKNIILCVSVSVVSCIYAL